MTMPGLTGRELAQELLAVRRDIPIIICSGFTEFVNAKESKEAGISEFLMKPYVTGRMAEVIRRVLKVEENLSTLNSQLESGIVGKYARMVKTEPFRQ
jgi:FixJ family two-component response regulator